MYKDKYLIFSEQEEIIKTKDPLFQLFYLYVKKIYIRYERNNGNCQLWEDFPCDLYTDIRNWIDKNSVKEIKEYIDYVKDKYPHTKESAKLFWQHWLSYKNINKNIK